MTAQHDTAHERLSVSEVRTLLADADGRRLARLLRELGDDPRPGVRTACESAGRRHAAARREAARLRELYRIETEIASQGQAVIAGVDEVGRGALAGPLTAAACVLPASPHVKWLNDSKKLLPPRRAEVAAEIRSIAVAWSVAHVEADDVDRLGMTEALRVVMRKALEGLCVVPDRVLLDGLPLGLCSTETAYVGGDGRVAAIAAASVIAKVARDELMVGHARSHPEYGFDENKGYSTRQHLDAIGRVGRCALHRVTFCPGRGTEPLF